MAWFSAAVQIFEPHQSVESIHCKGNTKLVDLSVDLTDVIGINSG
jgi:hypothetical protein